MGWETALVPPSSPSQHPQQSTDPTGLLCRAKAGCGENGGSPSPFQPQQGTSPSLPHPDGAGHRGPHVRAWT